ncbi:MAG: 4a-hydroxytetrahydrobiopterin dehydratase [Phycisphaeraceae bacterium JB051]
MSTTPTKLADAQISARLEKHPEWTRENHALNRTFVFEDFDQAFAFMSKVAEIAKNMNHHPDWQNVYNKLTINLSTHDVDGISDLDFEMMEKIDALLD